MTSFYFYKKIIIKIFVLNSNVNIKFKHQIFS